MIRDKLKRYYSDRGFTEVNLHTNDMDLFYTSVSSSASLVWIISETALQSMDKEDYDRYFEKIRQTFLQKDFVYVNTLSLFLTSDGKRAADLAEGTAFWVADEKYGRLIIYENQPEDFCGSKLHVEQFLSFFGTERAREEEIAKRQEEERLRREEYINAINNRRVQNRYQGYAYPNNSGVRRNRYAISNKPYIVIGLIIINLAILLLVNLFGKLTGFDTWLNDGSISWMAVLANHEYYRFITSMFLHAGVDHIFGNMLVLYVAGELLEKNVGHIKFFIIYILGGMAGSVTSCYYYYSTHQIVECIGASGAVFAVVGALVMCTLLDRESLLELGNTRIIIFALFSLYSGFTNEGVDNAAHVGGLIGGGLIYLAIYSITKLWHQVRDN